MKSVLLVKHSIGRRWQQCNRVHRACHNGTRLQLGNVVMQLLNTVVTRCRRLSSDIVSEWVSTDPQCRLHRTLAGFPVSRYSICGFFYRFPSLTVVCFHQFKITVTVCYAVAVGFCWTGLIFQSYSRSVRVFGWEPFSVTKCLVVALPSGD